MEEYIQVSQMVLLWCRGSLNLYVVNLTLHDTLENKLSSKSYQCSTLMVLYWVIIELDCQEKISIESIEILIKIFFLKFTFSKSMLHKWKLCSKIISLCSWIFMVTQLKKMFLLMVLNFQWLTNFIIKREYLLKCWKSKTKCSDIILVFSKYQNANWVQLEQYYWKK